jgi:hypothetical protein
MPVYVKSGKYDLGKAFVAGGGNYTKVSADSLRLWVKFKPSPEDLSGNSISISYNGSPQSSVALIPSKEVSRIGELEVGTFNSSSSAQAAATSELDFSGDVPFSAAGWLNKVDDGNSRSIFAMPNVGNTNYGWLARVQSTKRAQFYLRGTGGGLVAAGTNADTFPLGVWTHFAVTYDGSKQFSGIAIYINGKKQPLVDLSTGTFTSLDANGSRDLRIASDYDGSNSLAGSLSELGVWGLELQESDVLALYHSTAGRYYAKSGIISLPNRVRTIDEGNRAGAYPTQLRTTGKKSETGDTRINFDDTRVQIFRALDNAVYPLVNSKNQIEKLDTSSLIPTPNQNSTLVAPATPRAVFSTDGAFIESNGEISLEPFNESDIFLKDKADPFYASGTLSSDYPGYGSPLRDKIAIRIPINNKSEKTISRYSGHHIPNDPDGLFPGSFKSTGFYYYNFNMSQWEDIDLTPETSMFYSGSAAPVSCVSLGKQIKDADGFFGEGPGSPSLPKLQQFKMSDHMGVFVDSAADTRTSKPYPYADLTASLGYHLIGAPTEAGLAPWHPRYHATGSQSIRISDYINSELAIEKVVLDIPVVVHRQMGGRSGDGSPSNRFFDSCRDVDNYMFFLYRQKRSPALGRSDDSQYAMTASRRELICSGAASFYNSNAFSGRVPKLVREKGLPHTPAFSHDFNVAVTPSANDPVVNIFTGSIRVEMKVATANGQAVGGSRFPLAGGLEQVGPDTFRGPAGGVFSYERSVVTQDWWSGGRSHPSSSLTTHSTRNSGSVAPLIFKHHQTYCAGLKPYAASQIKPARDNSVDSLGKPIIGRSARSFKHPRGTGYYNNFKYTKSQPRKGFLDSTPDGINAGILGYTCHTIAGSSNTTYPLLFGSLPSSDVSPFIMEWEDELVLGIDAGISMLPASGSSMSGLITAGVDAGVDLGFYSGSVQYPTFGCMSGSFMKIMPGQASLTIFGSQIREDQEVLGSSNQGLTSKSIHESIGDARVLDQIDTPQRYELSGSYVDRLIFGNVHVNQASLNSTNTVVKNATLNRVNQSGNFRKARGIVSYFSKNRTGFSAVDSSRRNWSSPDHDIGTGYPPSFSNRDFTKYNFFVDNQTSTKNINQDPYFITPKKAPVLLSSNIVSLQRFITLPFQDETYYDTMAPDIVSWGNKVGSSLGTVPAVRISRNPSNTAIPIAKIWTGNLEKINVHVYTGNPTRYLTQKFIAQIVPSSGSDASLVAAAPRYTEVPVNASDGFSASKLVLTTLFNRGFRYTNFDIKTPEQNLRGYFYNATGSHGPRYGMLSPVPARPVSVFRRDKFGQFRDMLEQSRDTKFFVNNSGKDRKSYIGDSPVQVVFVDSSDGKTVVDPFTTSCFNCSNESTSSIPYSDVAPSYTPPSDDGDVVSLKGTLFDATAAARTSGVSSAAASFGGSTTSGPGTVFDLLK